MTEQEKALHELQKLAFALQEAVLYLDGHPLNTAALRFYEKTRAEYGRQIEAVLGTASRYTPANTEAIRRLSWTAEEAELLLSQWACTDNIPEVPGGYYIGRNLNNAFRAVLYAGENPREMLLQWNEEINREILRKRKAYGLTGAQKKGAR